MSADILLVEDEEDIRALIAGILEDEGYSARTARDSDEALDLVRRRRPDLVFLDIWLQGSSLDGMELLSEVRKLHPDLPVVMISGHGTIETAVSAIRMGAYDYVEKPFKTDRLILVAQRALEASALRREINKLRGQGEELPELIGDSAVMSHLRETISRIAPAHSRVMLVGPPGSGKELAARSIHDLSSRRDGPFVVLNAGALSPDRIEVELFGAEERDGSPRKIGAFEEAHGGTLYLREVADLPAEAQAKILRALVEKRFERVDGSARVEVDVRVLSSTSRDLEALIRDGEFSEDLFHRLAVVPLRIPALVERREDIPSLVEALMKRIAHRNGLPSGMRVNSEAMAILQTHDWPGNIRQLRNNVERLMILLSVESGALITAQMLPSEIGEMLPRAEEGEDSVVSLPLREARKAFERSYLLAQLARFGGNVSQAAEFVGMERSALHRKLRSIGLGDGKERNRRNDSASEKARAGARRR